MTVLIIATDDDPHTVAVASEIEQQGGHVTVADLSLFPQQADMNLRFTCCGERQLSLRLSDRELDLATV